MQDLDSISGGERRDLRLGLGKKKAPEFKLNSGALASPRGFEPLLPG